MIKLEEFWMACCVPVYDASTNEYIDSNVVMKYVDAAVTKITLSTSYKNDGHIYIEFEKEPEEDA